MAPSNKKIGRIFVYVAIIGILAVVLIFLLLRNTSSTTEQPLEVVVPQAETIDIVITTQKIGRGGEITADVLTTIPYPRQDFIEGVFFTNASDVVGKWAKSDIEAHTPLTSDMIVSTLTGSYAAFQVPKGMVAVTIPINDRLSYVAYAPAVGDHINLIVTMLMIDLDSDFQSKTPGASLPLGGPGPTIPEKQPDSLTVYTFSWAESATVQGKILYDAVVNQPIYIIPSEVQRPRLVTQTLLQDVLILGVGDFKTASGDTSVIEEAIPGIVTEEQPAEVVTTGEAVILPDTITLVVTPQDAVTLTYLTYAGARFTLALRSPGDDQRIITQAGTLQFLLDQYNIPLPTKLPYGIEPRIDSLELPSQYMFNYPTETPEP
jgi:Flp pilus assembly protein CpaB